MKRSMALRGLFFFAILVLVTCAKDEKGGGGGGLEALRKLMRDSKTSPLINLRASVLRKHVLNANRPHHAVVMFEASTDQCPYCPTLKSQMRTVAEYYNTTISNTNPVLFFFVANINTCPECFSELNVKNVPVVVYISPSNNEGQIQLKPFQITSMEHIQEPFHFARWVQQESSLSIKIPVEWYNEPMLRYTVAALLVALVLWKLPFLLRNYNHPYVGYVLTLALMGTVFSGQVWNAIHEPPYYQRTGPNPTDIAYVAGDMHQQYIIEGAVMAAIQICLAMLWILITKFGSSLTRSYTAYPVILGLIFVFCAVFFAQATLFGRHKMRGGYPFMMPSPLSDLPFFK